MYTIYSKDTLRVYVGTVSSVNETTRNGKMAVVVTLKDYAGEEKAIWFSNANDGIKPNRADNVKKLNLSVNQFVAVVAYTKDDSSLSVTGIRVITSGKSTFDSFNVVVATVIVPDADVKNNKFVVKVPIDEYVNNKKVTNWYRVTFWNSEDGKMRADKAVRVLNGRNKVKVALLCGRANTHEHEGKTYYSMTGYTITREPDKE